MQDGNALDLTTCTVHVGRWTLVATEQHKSVYTLRNIRKTRRSLMKQPQGSDESGAFAGDIGRMYL